MTFKINKVYTRTGDDGHTTLADGNRVAKNSKLIEAMGCLDEFCTELGAITSYTDSKEILKIIHLMQHEVFDLGAELATPNSSSSWTTSDNQWLRLEKLCDYYGKDLPELDSFILPGGSKLSTTIHRARVSARKAERALQGLNSEIQLNSNSLIYLNRASDMLFNMARYALKLENKQEILWKPKKSRTD
jgi:cob(I)alamin adenosyltransferase